jgi:hypothetical protein
MEENCLLVSLREETEFCLVRGDETVCKEIPRKEQRVSTGVLEHDAQETAALFGGCRVENAIFINYAISSSLAIKTKMLLEMSLY